jgi:septum formation protein
LEIILASSSPRRKVILEGLGLQFKIVAPEIDERILPGEKPIEHARRISLSKAESVLLELQNLLPEEYLIIACDTNVVAGKKVLGKPADQDDAKRMLSMLCNKKHVVISSVSLIHGTPRIRKKAVAHTVSQVSFKNFSNAMLEDYLESGEWQGKAGAYAIQGQGSLFLDWYQGSITCIIGFPLRIFFRVLSGIEINILSLW